MVLGPKRDSKTSDVVVYQAILMFRNDKKVYMYFVVTENDNENLFVLLFLI